MGNSNVLQYTYGNFVIDFVEIRRVKMVKIAHNKSNISLSEKCVKNLMKFERLIRLELDRLRCANVSDVYSCALSRLVDVDVENVESSLPDLPEMQSRIAYEMIYFDKSYFIRDLNLRKLYSDMEK